MTDYIHEDRETDRLADAYLPIAQAEIDAAIARIHKATEALDREIAQNELRRDRPNADRLPAADPDVA